MTMRLVIRCEPKLGEGLLGYLLRLVDLNSGDNLAATFQVARHSVYPALSRAADIVTSNSTAVGVRHFPYFFPDHTSIGKVDPIYFHGHSLERPEVNFAKPKFCPTCLSETLMLPAIWELTHYVVCPKHRTILESYCAQCGTSLSWMRRSLHSCHNCKFDFRNTKPRPASKTTIEFVRLIERKILNQRLHSRSPKFEIAANHLNLQELLSLCTHIGRPRLIKEKNPKFSCRNALETVEAFVRNKQCIKSSPQS
ncbi:TniQ family protein [Ferrovibrio sp.]|uniref:TniQ family protein n=1 Tax=Ferrovibrio sp. TaxID=1917215 RepID=UPI000CB9E95C|nr:MAG: hypothetical protein CTR53_05160 [Ferrovibrio sp.]